MAMSRLFWLTNTWPLFGGTSMNRVTRGDAGAVRVSHRDHDASKRKCDCCL